MKKINVVNEGGVDHSARLHARFSASGSAKWMNCAGALQAEEGYENPSSIFAQEGTRAHEVADLALSSGKPAIEWLGAEIEGGIVDEDMVHYVQQYIDYIYAIRDLVAPEDRIELTESRVDFSHLAPDAFGTLDAAVILISKKECHIFDLKYGRGVKVSAYQNTQAMLYASGILNDFDFMSDSIKQIHVHICQPRIHNFSEWVVTVEELLEWQQEVKCAVEAALQPNPPRTPSEKACKWCLAKVDCKAIAKFYQDEILEYFDDLDDFDGNLPDPEKLSDEEKVKIISAFPLVKDWVEKLTESMERRVLSGETVNGLKLIRSRGSTQLTRDGEKILSAQYPDKIYRKVLLPITELRKVLGKKAVEEVTVKVEGSLKVVPSSHPSREAFIGDGFTNLDAVDND